MEQYLAPLWIVILLFLALTVLFILSKLLIIRNKLKTIREYTRKMDELYAEDGPEDEAPVE